MSDLLKTLKVKLKELYPNLSITDNPNDVKNNSGTKEFLFKGYVEDSRNKISILLASPYFAKLEELPPSENELSEKLVYDGEIYKVLEYDSEKGIVTLDKEVSDTLFPYNDVFIGEDANVVSKDFIYIYIPYHIGKPIDGNLLEIRKRVYITFNIFEDENNSKTEEYANKFIRTFNRKMFDIDEPTHAYYLNSDSLNVGDYNLNNRKLKASLLVREYNR